MANEAPTTVIEQAPPETPKTEVLGNAPEARTAQGEIKSETPTPPTPTATTDKKAEAKPADKPAETKDGKTILTEKPKEVPFTGAPEKYEAFSAPEGYELNEDRMGKASEVFKKLNLSQAGGQELMNLFTDEIKSVMEAPAKQWEETTAKWLSEVKSDPEIGGKLDQVKVTVARAIDNLGDPKLASEFRQAMDFTGVGNNPAFIRAFYKLAQKVTEGTSVPGGGPVEVKAPNAPPRTAAHALYPNLK